VSRGVDRPQDDERHYDGTEPVRGLPQRLPPGETMLWQGAPDWQALARRAFHIRGVAIYFALLLVWYGVSLLTEPGSVPAPEMSALPLAVSALVVPALILGFSFLISRTTVYTITSKRVVMRFGMALPMTWNIPFARLSDVDVKLYPEGAGELVLTAMPDDKFSYAIMWPHVKPWCISKPRPTLRCVPEASKVARILSQALVAGGHGLAPASLPEPLMGDLPSPERGRHAPQPV
jgi:hypothetical protein